MARKQKLTPKQEAFVREYLIDLNATRAYKVAYSRVKNDDVAAAAAARLLRNVKVLYAGVSSAGKSYFRV